MTFFVNDYFTMLGVFVEETVRTDCRRPSDRHYRMVSIYQLGAGMLICRMPLRAPLRNCVNYSCRAGVLTCVSRNATSTTKCLPSLCFSASILLILGIGTGAVQGRCQKTRFGAGFSIGNWVLFID